MITASAVSALASTMDDEDRARFESSSVCRRLRSRCLKGLHPLEKEKTPLVHAIGHHAGHISHTHSIQNTLPELPCWWHVALFAHDTRWVVVSLDNVRRSVQSVVDDAGDACVGGSERKMQCYLRRLSSGHYTQYMFLTC